jgi:hypothetical protein
LRTSSPGPTKTLTRCSTVPSGTLHPDPAPTPPAPLL